MTMHLPRIRYQRAAEVLLGVAAANSRGQLARIWFDALSDCEERIEGMMWETNSRRAEAAAMARWR